MLVFGLRGPVLISGFTRTPQWISVCSSRISLRIPRINLCHLWWPSRLLTRLIPWTFYRRSLRVPGLGPPLRKRVRESHVKLRVIVGCHPCIFPMQPFLLSVRRSWLRGGVDRFSQCSRTLDEEAEVRHTIRAPDSPSSTFRAHRQSPGRLGNLLRS